MTNNRGQEERGWGSHGQSCSGISVQRGRSWDKVDRGKKVSQYCCCQCIVVDGNHGAVNKNDKNNNKMICKRYWSAMV